MPGAKLTSTPYMSRATNFDADRECVNDEDDEGMPSGRIQVGAVDRDAPTHRDGGARIGEAPMLGEPTARGLSRTDITVFPSSRGFAASREGVMRVVCKLLAQHLRVMGMPIAVTFG